jgi:hypothetical protein
MNLKCSTYFPKLQLSNLIAELFIHFTLPLYILRRGLISDPSYRRLGDNQSCRQASRMRFEVSTATCMTLAVFWYLASCIMMSGVQAKRLLLIMWRYTPRMISIQPYVSDWKKKSQNNIWCGQISKYEFYYYVNNKTDYYFLSKHVSNWWHI